MGSGLTPAAASIGWSLTLDPGPTLVGRSASRGRYDRAHGIEEGKPAPTFSLVRATLERPCRSRACGASPSSSTSIPKDDTPGCTAQACGIRDALGRVRATPARSSSASAPTDEASHAEVQGEVRPAVHAPGRHRARGRRRLRRVGREVVRGQDLHGRPSLDVRDRRRRQRRQGVPRREAGRARRPGARGAPRVTPRLD